MRYLLIAGLALGCGRSKLPADAAPPSTTDAAPGSSLPSDLARRGLRDIDLGRQHRLEPPAGMPAVARALMPADTHLVAWGLERGMALTRPAPGVRKVMLRWVTAAHGAALRTQLAAHLAANGFRPRDPGLKAGIPHPEHGLLMVKITEETDRATRVELTLQGADSDTPLEDPTRALHPPLDWFADAVITPIGYELAHFHAVRFKGAYTDLQRLAYTVRMDNETARQALALRLVHRAKKMGFKERPPDSGIYRLPDGGMFTLRDADDPRALVVHLQRRWTRPWR